MSTHNICFYGADSILISTHICFYGELTKIILQLSSNTHHICFTEKWIEVSSANLKAVKNETAKWSADFKGDVGHN